MSARLRVHVSDRDSKWSSIQIMVDLLRVYLCGEPWVDVKPSQLLRDIGRIEDGLFAARSFDKGTTIGQYTGKRVKAGKTGPYVAQIQPQKGKAYYVDGRNAMEPFVQKINSPHGLPCKANVRYLRSGRIVALRSIAQGTELLMEYNWDAKGFMNK